MYQHSLLGPKTVMLPNLNDSVCIPKYIQIRTYANIYLCMCTDCIISYPSKFTCSHIGSYTHSHSQQSVNVCTQTCLQWHPNRYIKYTCWHIIVQRYIKLFHYIFSLLLEDSQTNLRNHFRACSLLEFVSHTTNYTTQHMNLSIENTLKYIS